MVEVVENQTDVNFQGYKTTTTVETTEKLHDRVGGWPRLLSKKFLAIEFDCWQGNRINVSRFRSLVLTKEVLAKAGIPEEVAYSQKIKTFNALYSMKLSKILQAPILALFAMFSFLLPAQTPSNQFLFDTIPGMAIIADSMVRMVQIGNGEYRYQSVMSTVVVDAIMVQKYQLLVRGDNGTPEPVDQGRTFFMNNGAVLDPNRIIIFKKVQK